MAHLRKQLRDKVKTMLVTALGTSNVFTWRTNPIQESECPAANIRTPEDSLASTTFDDSDRDIQLVIDIYERAYEDVADLLDALCVSVENAFIADTTINADYKDLISTSIDISDGDQQIANATMIYRINVVNAIDPETVI